MTTESRPSPLGTLATWAVRVIVALLVLVLTIWSVVAIYYSNLPVQWLRTGAAVTYVLVTVALFALLENRRRAVGAYFLLFAGVLTWWLLIPASHDGDWLVQYEVMPHATVDGDRVTIHDIRNFDYRSADDFTVGYYDKTFELDELTSVDFSLSYWDGNTDIAHFLISFGFRDEDYVAVSVETRREAGEPWGTLPGFFKQYELMLIMGDERDLLRLRTNIRNEEVYLYPTVLGPEERKAIFMNIVRRMNGLYEEPEFYNTIADNCLTGLLQEFQDYRKKKAFDIRLLKNGLADQMAHENGMIRPDLSFEETRKLHHINQYVTEDPPDYSRRIRPHLE